MKLTLLLWMALGTAACSTGYSVSSSRPTVPPFAPAGATATVCSMRPQWFALAVPLVHHDNGRLVGLLRGGNVYFCWRAAPGWHRINMSRAFGWGASQHGVARVQIYLRPGQRLYLQIHLAFLGSDRLVAVAEGHARRLIPGMTFQVTRKWSRKMRPVYRGVVPALGARARAPGSRAPAYAPDTRYAAPPPPPQPGAKARP